jgi:hypothetical protein
MPNTSTVATRSAMAALTHAAGDSAILTEAGREGLFRWSTDNHSDGIYPVANHANTTVNALGQGWYGLQKTGGADSAYNASAISAHGATGAVAMRLRAWNQLSFSNVVAGFNTSPGADDSYQMTLSVGLSGSSYFIGSGATTFASGAHDWSRYDILLYRDATNHVKVYSCPRAIEIVPNAIEAQLAANCVLIYSYTTTYSGTLYFDSSIYTTGNGAQIQFIDVGAGGDGLAGADIAQGVCVPPASDTSGASGAWLRIIEGAVKAAWFGAAGDGVTNDTAALASAAAYLRRVGGGTLEFEPRTYVIGGQTSGTSPQWSLEPATILYFTYCHRKVTIRGNGCTLLCAPALKYGQFNPTTGASSTGSPTDPAYRASPFQGAIFAELNAGDIEIDGVTVDGNLANLTIGGSWGDTGIQIPFDAFRLYDNTGALLVRNCKAYRLGLDGLDIRRNLERKGDAAQPTLIEDYKADGCGRQGASFVGARMLTVVNSQFLNTGRNGYVASNPQSGIDVEPDNGGYADEILFLNCIAAFNAGSGMGVGSGRDSRILWKGGRLLGTENYALWIEKPDVRFEDALIAGDVMCAWQDNLARGFLEEGDAPGFVRCTFTDDTDYSYLQGDGTPKPFYSNEIQLNAGRTWFQRCRFDYRRTYRLPNIYAVGERTVFEDCDLHCDVGGSQTGSYAAIWLGLNRFSGIGLSFMPYFNLKDVGGVVRWGVGGSKTYDWPSIPNGSNATTTVSVPRARVGDGYIYEARMLEDGMNNAGLAFTAAVTATDVVTVTATNSSGAAVDLASGTLIVEVQGGRPYFQGAKTYDWSSIGAGSVSTTTLDVPGARVGDKRVYRASMSAGWGGLIASCEPTADDTVTVTAFNPTGSAVDLASGTLSVAGVA